MNYYQLSAPFCLFTTSYKSKKISSDRPPKIVILSLTNRRKNHYYLVSRHKKREIPFLVSNRRIERLIIPPRNFVSFIYLLLCILLLCIVYLLSITSTMNGLLYRSNKFQTSLKAKTVQTKQTKDFTNFIDHTTYIIVSIKKNLAFPLYQLVLRNPCI